MMSKLKKNKKIFIGLIAVVLCLGIFLFVKEKYIANTTTKLFHDNNQKMAPEGTCKKIFDNGENSLVQFDVDEDEDDDTTIYISCYVAQATLNKYDRKKGMKFTLTGNDYVKSLSSDSITCKPDTKRVKVIVQDKDDNNGYEHWLVKARLAKDLKLDATSFCYAKDNGSDLGPGGSGAKSGTVAGGDNTDIGKVKNAEEGEGEASVDVSDVYEGDDISIGTDDAAAADSLNAGDEVEELSINNVQNNVRPWKNTSTRGNKNNTSDYNTFTHMQKYELGWEGDTWTGKPNKTNLLSEKYGNHAVFPDDDNKVLDSYGARKNIIDTGIEWKDEGGQTKYKGDNAINLACNYDLSLNQINEIKKRNQIEAKLEDGTLTNYYYDQSNTTYFYGEQETVVPGGTLKYIAHTDGALKGPYTYKTQTVLCRKKCQEIVKVEYGPPVYVNAGLCFEYRVKALSIVRCKTIATEGLNKPKVYKNKCSPVPICWHGKSSSRQGGPSEEFENCINSCDGGIYSKDCSNKCYEAVYGDPQQALQDLAVRKMEATAKKLGTTESSDKHHASTCSNNSVYGGHYYRSGKSVKYCQMAGQNTSCQGYSGSRDDAGLWYILNTYSVKQRSSSTYKSTGNGLIKACLGGGKICPDNCYWTGCKSSKSYLIFRYNATNKGGHNCDLTHNYGTYIHYYKENGELKEEKRAICTERDQMKADYEINMKRYREAKEKCKTKTVCTTSTATYTIGFKYSTGEKNVVVEFPYTGKDRLTSEKTPGKKEYKDDGITSLLSYGGCYRNGSKDNWYQTEWTFPGTYEDSKTHEKTYVKPSTDGDYFVQKGLVCLPQELSDTNVNWGKKYYNLAYGKDEGNPVVAETKTYSTVKSLRNGWKCTFKKKSSIANFSDTSKAAEGYNVKASSEHFGFFKWKFNVYCFYSLLNDPTKFELKQNDPDNKCIKTEKYVAGTQVDTFNTSDPLLEGTNNRVQYRGDATAYNWNVTLTRMTEGGYDQDPKKLLAEIKADKNTFAKPEFEFRLTPEIINKIKKYNKDNPLGNFDVKESYPGYNTYDQIVARNGVVYYRSYFLRNYMASSSKFRRLGDYDTYAAINNTKYPGGIKEVNTR